jgi:hypothetical protein
MVLLFPGLSCRPSYQFVFKYKDERAIETFQQAIVMRVDLILSSADVFIKCFPINEPIMYYLAKPLDE